MLPAYDDFLIRRFEQPDEIRTFEKGKFETVKIGSMTIGRARLRRLWNAGWPLSRDACGRFVLHRTGPRQLGGRR
jgi:hypothetical protein